MKYYCNEHWLYNCIGKYCKPFDVRRCELLRLFNRNRTGKNTNFDIHEVRMNVTLKWLIIFQCNVLYNYIPVLFPNHRRIQEGPSPLFGLVKAKLKCSLLPTESMLRLIMVTPCSHHRHCWLLSQQLARNYVSSRTSFAVQWAKIINAPRVELSWIWYPTCQFLRSGTSLVESGSYSGIRHVDTEIRLRPSPYRWLNVAVTIRYRL